jgi:hypothetical protein
MKPITESKINKEDVAIVLVGYNRPNLLEQRILEISRFNPAHLYIYIDGGASQHMAEFDSVKNIARELFDKQVLRIEHSAVNLGISLNVTRAISKVLKLHNYMIFVEDDVKLSEKFFENMLNGLNHQIQYNLTGVVSGYSSRFGVSKKNKWFKQGIPNFWGWACSAKTWDGFKLDLTEINLLQELSKSYTWHTLLPWEKSYLLKSFTKVKRSPSYSWDPQFIFHLLIKNHINIAPIYSLTGNVGFGDKNATHTGYSKPAYIKNDELNNTLVDKFSRFSCLHDLSNLHIFKHELKMLLVRSVGRFS